MKKEINAYGGTLMTENGRLIQAGGATLAWDAKREVSGDPAADAMLTPFARGKYDLKPALAAAGLDYRKMIKPLA